MRKAAEVVADASGRVFFADRLNGRVRMVDGRGRISTLAGNGSGTYSGDGGSAATAGAMSATGTEADVTGGIAFGGGAS